MNKSASTSDPDGDWNTHPKLLLAHCGLLARTGEVFKGLILTDSQAWGYASPGDGQAMGFLLS